MANRARIASRATVPIARDLARLNRPVKQNTAGDPSDFSSSDFVPEPGHHAAPRPVRSSQRLLSAGKSLSCSEFFAP